MQELVGQVGRWVDIAQRRDDLFTHEPDRAHELFVLNATKHHPVADVGDTDTGGACEFFDDGGRAAKEESVQIGRLIKFAFVRSSIDPAIADVLPVQATLRPVLLARIRQRGIGLLVCGCHVRHGL